MSPMCNRVTIKCLHQAFLLVRGEQRAVKQGTHTIHPTRCTCVGLVKILLHSRYCIVEGCGEMSHTTTHIVTHDIAQEYLDLVPTPESGSAIPQNLTLCNSHYQFLYRKVHFPEPCASCFTEPNYGGKYTRCCPDPEQISAF